jgi:hypothetical protein
MRALFLLLLLLLTACELVVNIDVPRADALLVVDGAFEVGQPWQIGLSRSIPVQDGGVYSERSEPVEVLGATVEIYSEGQLVERLVEQPSVSCELTGFSRCGGRYSRIYAGTSLPQAGTTYTLRVSHPDFAAVEATSRAPLPIGRERIAAELEGRTIRSSFEEVAHITIDDDAQTQYYALDFVHERVEVYERDTLIVDYIRFTSRSPFFLKGIEFSTDVSVDVSYRTGFMSDVSFSNASATVEASLSNSAYCYPQPSCRPEWLFLDLYAISPSYFDYVRTLIAYQEGGGEGNPLAEPVQVQSNVTDGLGFFGGRTRTRIELRGPQ